MLSFPVGSSHTSKPNENPFNSKMHRWNCLWIQYFPWSVVTGHRNPFSRTTILFSNLPVHDQRKCETKTKSISKNAQNFLASWILISDSPARFYLTLNFRCRNFFFKVDHRTKFWKQKRSVMPKLAPEFWFQVFSSKDLEKNEKIPKPFLDSFSSVKVAALRNFATRGQLITPNQSLTIW